MNSRKRYKKSELINFTYNILKKVGLNNSNSKIISDLIKSGRVQRDDLTIVAVDGN